MATYKVTFYNRESQWLHSSVEVDAVTPELAETQARNAFGPDQSYYRTGVEDVTPESDESVADESTEQGEEVDANG